MNNSFSRRARLGAGLILSFALPFAGHAQKAKLATPSAVSKTSAAVVYVNNRYGFRFNLPPDWTGYRILTQQWDGITPGPEPPRKESGPRVVIRDPRWTKAHPRQDIPVMVFTRKQWEEDLVVSAAPIGPSELGRNLRYVFALPPRYNFAFPDGYKEVEEIVTKKPLHPF